MGMISEFKEFAMKGNLVDMAVPIISPVMGGVDVGDMKFTMSEAVMENGEVIKEAAVVNIGLFINALISFIIVAFVMFMIIKGMNKAKKKEEAAPAAPPANEVLLAEIRDLLAK